MKDAEAETTLCGVIQEPYAEPSRSLDEQTGWLYDEQRRREAETRADVGDAIIDTGGWREIALGVPPDAPSWVTDAAKREYLRCNGLGR